MGKYSSQLLQEHVQLLSFLFTAKQVYENRTEVEASSLRVLGRRKSNNTRACGNLKMCTEKILKQKSVNRKCK